MRSVVRKYLKAAILVPETSYTSAHGSNSVCINYFVFDSELQEYRVRTTPQRRQVACHCYHRYRHKQKRCYFVNCVEYTPYVRLPSCIELQVM